MFITYSREWINRERLSILLVSAEQGKWIFPCPRSCLRIWSRETGSGVPSRVSLLISILRLSLVLTYGIPPDFRGGVIFFLKPPYAIGSSPEFIESHNFVPMELRPNLVLTYGNPLGFRGGVHLFIQIAIHHRVSPEFIGLHNCVPMELRLNLVLTYGILPEFRGGVYLLI